MLATIIEETKKELHGSIQKNNTNIHIEKILDQMYKVWDENKAKNEAKRPYIELYFFIYTGFGYLKVLCKNLKFSDFKVEYNKIINFFAKNKIKYNKNPLLKGKEMFQGDKQNRIIVKIFFLLDKLKLAKISLFIYNKLTN